MPDEKPQHAEETDQAKEETYIDALTLRLNHSVTDIYIPLAGGELALSVRRNVGGDVWNNTTGLTPAQHPDQPFGTGWTSNICPNVQLVSVLRLDQDPCARLTPTYIYVTDENGQTYKFIVLFTEASPSGVFVALPSSTIDQDSFSCTLTGSLETGDYVFTKKHGTKLTFAESGIVQGLPADRNHPDETSVEIHKWSRILKVEDRFGARLEYTAGPGLVPTAVTGFSGPTQVTGQTISITLEGGRVTSVQDPKGNTIAYAYDESSDGAFFFPQLYQTLMSVTNAAGVTNYAYEMVSEADSKPSTTPPNPALTYTHVDLGSITDPNENTYSFGYAFDFSKERYDTATDRMFTVNGEPRRIVSVTLPGSGVTFTPAGGLSFPADGTFAGFRRTTVVDAAGATVIYDFGQPVARTMNDWSEYLSSADHDTRRIPLLILQTRTTITYVGAGVEVFDFNPDAGMALAILQDLSGNVTTYDYNDPLPSIPTVGPPLFGYYADPKVEHRSWSYNGSTPVLLTKEFRYGTPGSPAFNFRIMSESIDELGRRTEYDIDSLGRRTAERIFAAASGTPIQETTFEYAVGFPGFMSRNTLTKQGEDPAWVTPLVKQLIPDLFGRVKQEIVNPGPADASHNLTTIYEYDLNNNKHRITDPNGHLKTFTYDALNRIERIEDEAAGSKTFDYDARGNKIAETDENEHTTSFEYDGLNRLITKTRIMSPGPNLITRYQYNAVNSRTHVEDPNHGTTDYEYDLLQRLVLTRDAANQETTYAYGQNSGASAFDSSAFKPTSTTDPRGVVTQMSYDTLYRLRSKSVEYSAGVFSTTQMNTDAVGNVTEEIDPLENIVTKLYDALNRLTLTTYTNEGGILSTEQRFYTSTGLLHRVTDELGNATDSEYDGAKRLVKVSGPAVDDGTGAMVRPITRTEYDRVGNVLAKIDPRGNQTDFEYDVRNRKTLVRRPAVEDASTGLTSRPEINWTYDNVGNIKAVQDERRKVTNSNYDNANRVIEILGPTVPYGPAGTLSARPTTTNIYDRNGNVLQVTDPNGNVTTNVYDALNRLTDTTTTSDPADVTVSYGYDAVGNRTTVTAIRDGNPQTTILTYDGLNRLLTTADPAAKTTILSYNALNKTSRTDSAVPGQVTQYTYDVRNRLRTVTYVGRSVDNRTMRYDFLGQLLEVLEPNKIGQADVAYAYDAMRRVASETSGEKTHLYVYDLAGNRVRVTYGGTGRRVDSTYDALNRLLTLTESVAP